MPSSSPHSRISPKALDSGASQLQTWRTRLRRYLQPPVLVIDEIGYTRLTPAQAHALFDSVNGPR